MLKERFPSPLSEPSEPSAAWLADFKEWASTKECLDTMQSLQRLGDTLFHMANDSIAPEAINVIVESSLQVINILSRHPVVETRDIVSTLMNVFGEEPFLDSERVRADVLSVLVLGGVATIVEGIIDETIIDALLFTAFGVDRAGRLLREVMVGRPIPNPDELPPLNVPIIDLERMQRLVVWGTIRDYLQALGRHGRDVYSYADWLSRAVAHANGITGLYPNKGCAGTAVTILGNGFGTSPGKYTSVYFPTTDGSCRKAKVLTAPNGSPTWSDTAITVEAPADVGIGCVGFVVFDGPPPTDPLGTYNEIVAATGMLQSVFGDAFGAAGVMFGQTVVDMVRGMGGFIPSPPCPSCLPADRNGTIPNRFVGGVPMIHSFTVNGQQSVIVRPNDQITLAWNTEGADKLMITSRKASSSRWDPVLPIPPGVQPRPDRGNTGAFLILYEGVDDWDGEYVLTTSNLCGTVTAFVRIDMREVPPLFGIADTHVHFLAHLGHAGYGIFGSPHASDPTLPVADAMLEALPWCSGPRGHGAGGILPSLEGAGGHLVGGFPEFDGWPLYSTLAHQQTYIDWIKRAVDGGLRLAVCLAVNSELLATRMTEIFGPFLSIDDMSSVTRQLDAMAAMVKFIDDQSGGAGQGWMQIAKSPHEARQIIASGKLALVMGIEVDSLGGWATPAALEADAISQGKTVRQLIAEMLKALHDKGVRHLFAVHGTNNAFGGAALFVRNYDAANFFKTQQSFTVEEAPVDLGISYRLDEDIFQGGPVAETLGYYGTSVALYVAGGSLTGLSLGGLIGGTVGAVGGAAVGTVAIASAFPCPPVQTNWAATPGGHINALSLTPHGKILIEEMMRLGMIIDIDHMGHKMTEEVLQMCEAQGYPVVSGHTGFRELKYGWRPTLEDRNLQFSKANNADKFGTQNGGRLSSEIDKTPEQLRRVRLLGGMVSVFTQQRDGLGCSCGNGFVPNDNAGSSKSFAQAFLYAHYHMHGRRVGLGTDVNGAGTLPGPRFGPQGAVSIKDEDDYEVRRHLGLPLRVDQVFGQTNGVRYSTPLVDFRHHRFMDYAGHPRFAPFDAEQRDFWEAIAIFRSGTAPETAEQPPIVQRPVATQNFIINLATGLRANSRAEIPININFPSSRPWPFYNVNQEEQLAAYLASHAGNDPLRAADPARTQQLVPKLIKIWEHWQAMEQGSVIQGTDQWTQQRFGPAGSGLYDANGNLTRSTAGRRDFDMNMDGMAHYGLMPDFLQDVRNVGVQLQTIQTLYRSADDYTRMWQRCEDKKLP